MESSYADNVEMANHNARSTQTQRRVSLKSQSHFNCPIWKDKLRENCYRRVREDRTRLLWKMRLSSSTSQSHCDKDFIESAFQDIVSDELKKIKDSTRDSFETSISTPDSDDILWEYDGIHGTYQDDCEEILLEMQSIFYEDLRSEATTKESGDQIETWEDEEDEYLARVVFENMRLNDEKTVVHKQVWCPICKKGELLENHQLIYCNSCELQLNKDNEITLDILRERLAEAHAEHLDRGCRLKPKFRVQTQFNLKALYILCDGCNTFEIII